MVQIHAVHRTASSNTKGYLTIQYYVIKNMDSCKSLLPYACSVVAEIFGAVWKKEKENNMEIILVLKPVLHRWIKVYGSSLLIYITLPLNLAIRVPFVLLPLTWPPRFYQAHTEIYFNHYNIIWYRGEHFDELWIILLCSHERIL